MFKLLLVASVFACMKLPSDIDASSGSKCYVSTTGNKCCVFPFTYRGKTYNTCTGSKPWCSLSPSYSRDGKWDYCAGMESMITGDDKAYLYFNGKYAGRNNFIWNRAERYVVPYDTEVLAVYISNTGGFGGLIGSFSNGIVTDGQWKCVAKNQANWNTVKFDDSAWPAARIHRRNSGGHRVAGVASNAFWIGVSSETARNIYCRRRITVRAAEPPVGGNPCNSPLGLESGWVENNQITASSVWGDLNAAWRGRLNMPRQYSYQSAWSAKSNNQNQWLQVSFPRTVKVTGVATQGRSELDQWVKSYKLSYSGDGRRFTIYSVRGQHQVFSGNTNRNSVVKHGISPAIEANFIRIHPVTWYGHVSMRAELYGCIMSCKVDIGILMDESGSVKAPDFVREKNFAKQLAGSFYIGPNGAQVGLITFGTNAHMDITLNSHSNLQSLYQSIDRIRQKGGWTYTDRALSLARSELFASKYGARSNVAKVLVIITDGRSTRGIHSLKLPVKQLKDMSVNLVSIGVGAQIYRQELQFMASDPVNSHVFYVSNMNQLQTLVSTITSASCSSFTCHYVKCEYSSWSDWSASCGRGIRRTRKLVKTISASIEQQGGCSGLKQTCDPHELQGKSVDCPCKYVTCAWDQWSAWSSTCGKMTRRRISKVTQHSVTRPSCAGLQTSCPAPETQAIHVSCCKADLGVLMDESGSVNNADFIKEKTFVAELANGFQNFNPNGIQMGVISFSTTAQLIIKLNDFSNKAQFMAAVRARIQKTGWTRTDIALELARTGLFKAGGGVRPGVSKVLIILTDGASTKGMASLAEPIRKLKESHVNIFAIGIGSNIRREELDFMASGPTHVFYVASMQQLPTLLGRISSSSCQDYTCRYVTCEYSQWSDWSASCGRGMSRTKKLTKIKQHTKQQQGGCSGLPITCKPFQTEQQNTNCPCKYVKCSLNSWGDWSATCGTMTRQRTWKVTQHSVNRPTCNGLQTSCPATQTQSKTMSCCKLDLGLLLDDSGSVSAAEFEQEKQFVGRLSLEFDNFGPTGIQMGVIVFSTTPKLRIKFNQYTKNSDFDKAVTSIRRLGGWTFTDRALKMAYEQLFSAKYGARKGVSKILLIITDGGSSGGQSSLDDPVTKLRDARVNIFSVGVGQRINMRELQYMAAQPKDLHVLKVPNMQELVKLIDQLSRLSCQMFTCKYVTCEYSQWSDWSASCGRGMSRTKKLTKVTEHTKQQQGGCSGLQTECIPRYTERKNTNCPCKYVTCAWKPWSDWSTTCGVMTRQRVSEATEHVINKPSCRGLQTKCPQPQLERKTTNCPCKTVRCVWNSWSAWSATCGYAQKRRTMKTTEIVVNQPNCAGLPRKCAQQSQTQTRKSLCTCRTVTCSWKQWSDWSATCGEARRSRTMRTTQITVQKEKCDGLPQSCPQKPEIDVRTTDCPCRAVKCEWEPWTGWTKTCGVAERKRQIKQTEIVVNRPSCSGLPQKCTEAPETQSRKVMCKCPTVKCVWNPWEDWSATCGKATRRRTIKTIPTTVDKLSCDGLPQKCTQAPESESREVKCSCPTVNCVWNPWEDWSTTCGKATRKRTIKTIPTTVDKLSCDGLPQRCTQAPESESREVKCSCPTVNCVWNPWEDWSATCGKATRKRTIKTIPTTVDKLSCDGLPQRCTQAPESESREVKCSCPTVKCVWNPWEDWSVTCGKATRKRTIKTIPTTVDKLSCDDLPQNCTEAPETESREVKCSCPTVKCVWNPWEDWSATCGKATRRRTIKTIPTTVDKLSCDGLPQTCTQTPEVENREKMCTCQTVTCNWSKWEDWSATCGPATRRRVIEATQTTVQKPNCDGLPQSCPQKSDVENRNVLCDCPTVNCTWGNWSAWDGDCGVINRTKNVVTTKVSVKREKCEGLPQQCAEQKESKNVQCEECYTVECGFNPWSHWSASCGLATRKRYLDTLEIVLVKPSCDGLPLVCPGEDEEKQTRSVPKCPTTAPPTATKQP